jgi:hypothetical protein
VSISLSIEAQADIAKQFIDFIVSKTRAEKETTKVEG